MARTNRKKKPEPPASPQPANLPGRDHRSLLLFLQTVEANNGGDVRHADTRGCAAGYPTRMRNKRLVSGDFAWDGSHGTRYDDGRQDGDHDDYDCMYDLIEWGFVDEVEGSTGVHPLIRLTDKGHSTCSALIRERAEQTRAAAHVAILKASVATSNTINTSEKGNRKT